MGAEGNLAALRAGVRSCDLESNSAFIVRIASRKDAAAIVADLELVGPALQVARAGSDAFSGATSCPSVSEKEGAFSVGLTTSWLAASIDTGLEVSAVSVVRTPRNAGVLRTDPAIGAIRVMEAANALPLLAVGPALRAVIVRLAREDPPLGANISFAYLPANTGALVFITGESFAVGTKLLQIRAEGWRLEG